MAPVLRSLSVGMANIPDDAAALGEWLAEAREAASLTQAELSQAAGVAVRTIQRWEAGEHAPVDVLRVLTALGVRFDPPEPEQVRALNVTVEGLRPLLVELEELRGRVEADEGVDSEAVLRHLEELSAQVGALPTAVDLKRGLESIRRSIARASRGTGEDPPANKRAAG